MIRATKARLLVEEIKEDESVKSAGGIIIATQDKAKPNIKGKVVSKGLDVSSEIQINDVIIFERYKSLPIELGEGTYLIVEEDNILGVYCG